MTIKVRPDIAALLCIVVVVILAAVLTHPPPGPAESKPPPQSQAGKDWSSLKNAAAAAYEIAKSNAIEVCKPYVPEVSIAKRHPLNLLTVQQEAELGERALQETRKTQPLSTNVIFIGQVDRVATNLVAAAAAEGGAFKWEFVVAETNEVNACCAPGGKIIVNTGMLAFVANSNELVFVIGHEVAHAVARHAGETISQQYVEQGGMAGIKLLLEFASDNGKISPETATNILMGTKTVTDLCLDLPHSREQEAEADHIGLVLMIRAGYDPRAGIDYFERMQKKTPQPGSPWEKYLSTHPVDADRIENLKQWLPKAAAENKK